MASISNNQESINKVQKILNKNDRISSLSDPLLIHILSFLPTKYAVGTSILSLRWKCLWASVPTLDFDSKLWFELNSDVRLSSNFLNFVERVLFNHDLSCIQKFRLYCIERKEHKLSRICTWIGVAIQRGVQELDIRIGVTEEQNYLPSSLFTCPTLVVLKLGLLVCFSVPRSVHFKTLKVLHISLGLSSNELTRNLFRNCPVLEDLIIKGDIPCNERLFFDVSTPALKSFKFDIDTDDGEDV
ncbi:F-box/LRR-repeat protein At4g14103-like [Cornus florida]|uniref:F-box/LRR-repeat protein At4g14103-like n=1 Tax=Cornus florida TaxID=4283 RepID=UPI0028A258CF|nr:F-box/LRR-repeat protein At4g14103-like [Cornus florida]